jgi:hypothetical protein
MKSGNEPYGVKDLADRDVSCRAKRCEHLSATGRRCRLMVVSATSGLCATHERKKRADVTKLADDLEKYADSFHTPQGVSDVMFVLFFALVEGRITERRAGILTYMLQTILHAQRAIERKEEDEKLRPIVRPIINDLPGPMRGEDMASCRRRIAEEDDLTWNLPYDDEPEKPAGPNLATEAAESTEKKTDAVQEKTTAVENSAATDVAKYSSPSSPFGSVSSVSSVVKQSSSSPKAKPTQPSRSVDLNHFFPVDPALPAHVQDANRVSVPPPSEAEVERRNRQFDRTQGIARRGRQSYPTRESPDWKILNGR